MLERELGLAGERAALARDDDVLFAQRAQRLGQIATLGFGDRSESALPERPPDHRGVREQAPLERLERVEARRQQGLHRRRQLGRAGALRLGQAAHHLLDEQRVALGARGDGGEHLLADALDAHQRGDQLARLALAERLEEDRRGVAAHSPPTGPALEQLFAREADLQHRRARPLQQMLDQIEHPLIGPVDVLPHEHQRPVARQPFDARTHRGEEDFPRVLGVLLLGERLIVGGLDAEQAADHGRLERRGSAVRLGRVEQLADLAESFSHAAAGGSPSMIRTRRE